MDRLKTFLKYIIWIALFFIFSNVMINFCLETNYKDLERKDEIKQVNIYQAQATKVNGRIKGAIFNDVSNKITNKYVRIDLFSKRGVNLGSKYIDVSSMRDNETKYFEEFFKLENVEYYEVVFTDEKIEGELPQMLKDLTKEQVIFATLLTYLIFW